MIIQMDIPREKQFKNNEEKKDVTVASTGGLTQVNYNEEV